MIGDVEYLTIGCALVSNQGTVNGYLILVMGIYDYDCMKSFISLPKVQIGAHHTYLANKEGLHLRSNKQVKLNLK